MLHRWPIDQVQVTFPLWSRVWACFDGLPRLSAILVTALLCWVAVGILILLALQTYRWISALIDLVG